MVTAEQCTKHKTFSMLVSRFELTLIEDTTLRLPSFKISYLFILWSPQSSINSTIRKRTNSVWCSLPLCFAGAILWGLLSWINLQAWSPASKSTVMNEIVWHAKRYRGQASGRRGWLEEIFDVERREGTKLNRLPARRRDCFVHIKCGDICLKLHLKRISSNRKNWAATQLSSGNLPTRSPRNRARVH